ncbi:MAG: hypothetical protein MZV63_16810 [Marinilabiliales bacterium]|nr:hypothetical protein [Marinilabiliales bacterium]
MAASTRADRDGQRAHRPRASQVEQALEAIRTTVLLGRHRLARRRCSTAASECGAGADYLGQDPRPSRRVRPATWPVLTERARRPGHAIATSVRARASSAARWT